MNSGAARLVNVLSVSLGTAPAHVGETMQRMNPSSPVDDQVIVGKKKEKGIQAGAARLSFPLRTVEAKHITGLGMQL